MFQNQISYSEQDFSWDFLPYQNESIFWNILAVGDSVLDPSFSKNKSCAAYVKSFEETKKLPDGCKIYFAPSVGFCLEKQNTLKNCTLSQIDFGIDPYSLGLWQSKLFKSQPLDADVRLLEGHKYFRLSSLAYDLAGANDEQQIAILLASFSQLLEDYEGRFSIDEIIELTSFEITVCSNVFKSIVKLQSFRMLFEYFLRDKGVKKSCHPVFFTLHSPRRLAAREPWNNILRMTSANTSAQLGGASGIVNLPCDLFSKGEQNRISRNIELILTEESHLSKVANSCQGSWSAEVRLKDLCLKSSMTLKEILNKEGLKSVISSGWLQDEIQRVANFEKDEFTFCKTKMTGVNDFCLTETLDPKYPLPKFTETISVENWFRNYMMPEQLEGQRDVERLIPSQLSRVFEKWQFLGDAYREKSTVVLHIEPGLENSAKAINTKRLLGVGGFETVESGEGKLNVIIAADPDGVFTQDSLHRLRKNGLNVIIWAGEKQMDGFDAEIGASLNLPEVFEKIYNAMGVQ